MHTWTTNVISLTIGSHGDLYFWKFCKSWYGLFIYLLHSLRVNFLSYSYIAIGG